MSDLISRQAAIDALEREKTYCRAFREGYAPVDIFEKYNDGLTDGIKAISNLPSAQRWNEIHKRPMTDEERKEWSERLGYDIEYDEAYIYSNLPDDGQEVFVSTQYGRVYVDTFCQDDGCYFEENGDMDGIVAWMPLPEPWKGVDE